ncbi:Transmembrane protein, partial [Trema orientale]
MKNDWEEVVKIYERDRRAYNVKITRSGHTALHLAVSDVKRDIVEKLVELIKREDPAEAKQVLELRNDKGHTPLHLAAATGDLRICQCIAAIDKSLALARDSGGETPIFRAVHYGRKKAFIYLHSVLQDAAADDEERYSCCKRYDRDQIILHDAIIRENFDLAIIIIQLYKELVNYVDKEGDSPLHALARKPAAFESGSHHQGLDRIVYN